MKTTNRWNTVFGILFISLIIFALLFATPIIGSYSADFLFEDALGCSVTSGLFDNHDTNHACSFYGWDVSDKVAAYSTPILSQFITPYSFILAFYDVIIVWLVMIAIAFKKSAPSPDKRTILDNLLYWVFFLFPFILILLVFMSPTINRYNNYELRYIEPSSKTMPLIPINENSHSGIRR